MASPESTNLFAFAAAAGVKVIYSLRLLSPAPARSAT
jgi:hypothetical protein